MTEHQHSGFGETLRRRREQLGLSLNDVAVRTRIRKTYLQALEEENLSVLPGAAYVIGFLRIYAQQLDLAVDPLVAALPGKAEAGNEHKTDGGAGRSRGRVWRLLLLLLFIGLGVAAYLFYRAGQASLPPSVVPPPLAAENLQPPPALPLPHPPEPDKTSSGPEAAVLSVIPAEGAVVRMLAVSAGEMRVALDGQESRAYQLAPGQQLNWKVSGQLLLELSATGLIRCWVGEQELPLAEHTVVRLVATPPAPAGRP